MDDLSELAEAIVEWSAGRPTWERVALAVLASGASISDEHVQHFADLAEQQARGETASVEVLTTSNLAHDESPDEQVRVRGVHGLRFVNALRCEDGLDFAADGITLVYGENGSGKSGFARVLKKATRARHASDVLTDVFANPGDQSAILRVEVGSADHNVNWPEEDPAFLRRVSFYDSDCAARYISADTEVAYRPWAISLLDSLVSVCSRVRDALQRRQAERSTESVAIPLLPPGSRAAQFIDSLSADTKSFEVDMASELPDNVDVLLASLRARIQTLQVADQGSRQQALGQVAADVRNVRDHVRVLRQRMSDQAVEELQIAASEAADARHVAELASAKQFESLPVGGVGSEDWRHLWESARRFSEQVAYPDRPFPVVGLEGEPAHCLLCQQSLDDESQERLKSFEVFVAADTAREALDKEDQLTTLAKGITSLEVDSTPIAVALARIAAEDSAARDELRAELRRLESRRVEVSGAMPTFTLEVPALAEEANLVCTAALEQNVENQLADLGLEDSDEQLAQLRGEEAEMNGRQLLRDSRAEIDLRVRRLRESRVLDEAIRLTDTRGVTRRAADLTRTHVSDVMKHQFSQETLLLDVRRVRLGDAGGGQGNLLHRAQLVGAVQRATLETVLSEGEQNALGLAGFLTEVESDSSRSAVILDDPVTSLDHVRQERVARRLVDLATTRQVVIFTHDIAFMIDLKRAAEAGSVPIEEHWVTRRQGNPGHVVEGGPWDARTVKERIGDLERKLAEVRRVFEDGDPASQQEVARSWYQDMRTVWERAVEEVVLGPVLVRGRLELRPSNLKVFAKFTDDDDREFQAAFTRCGERGSHDRSSQLNRPLPSIDELEQDLAKIRTWHKRVRGYANG